MRDVDTKGVALPVPPISIPLIARIRLFVLFSIYSFFLFFFLSYKPFQKKEDKKSFLNISSAIPTTKKKESAVLSAFLKYKQIRRQLYRFECLILQSDTLGVVPADTGIEVVFTSKRQTVGSPSSSLVVPPTLATGLSL